MKCDKHQSTTEERKPETMRITVILCTYNRCRSLQKALSSAAALVLPESVEWEILVVDNNSNDQTRETVKDSIRRYPGRFRYLFEPQPGKSHALNTGIRMSRGDVLAFMDDDVVVHQDWLNKLTFALHNGEWAGAGGRILPKWNCPPPRWLAPESSRAAGPLVAFHPMPQAGQIFAAPIGTNMAFRREMFEKYGNFRIDLGPRPGSELRNEDTEFGERLLAAGERLRYEPSAIVFHPVTETRLKKEYFLAWWLNKGEANIRQFGARPCTRYRIAGIPLYLLRRFAKWTLKWIISSDPAERFSNKLSAWENLGEIRECYREAAVPKKRPESCSV
ncbi:MAG: hypothetical protein DMG37_00420 [Acidobacteria bacterium]|nr:MAG: hypothetical protein DMG37_00420 [Acidobacteriota bacterium]